MTLRLVDDFPNLRTRKHGATLFRAFAAARERFGMRITHFSIQSNHMHFIVEASDRRALSRGAQGLVIRLAKRLNARTGRRGTVFADRYHARALRNPLEVRRAVRYVMNNHRRHHLSRGGGPPSDWADPYSSVDYFDGYRPFRSGPPRAEFQLGRAPPVAQPRTWLLQKSWRKLGLIEIDDVPGPRRPSG